MGGIYNQFIEAVGIDPSWLDIAASALIALGVSVLVASALSLLRRRRRGDGPREEIAGAVVDVILDTPTFAEELESEQLQRNVEMLEARLDEIDGLLNHLEGRVEQVLANPGVVRPSPQPSRGLRWSAAAGAGPSQEALTGAGQNARM